MILHVSKSPRISKFFLTTPSIYATIKRVIRGRHPSEKTEITEYAKSNTKGATPIEKNVIVVDEQGKVYEATYPKRAKGLVKNGRARFVAENKICLACPPNEYLEDKNMSENTNKTNSNTVLTEKEIFDQIVLLQSQLIDNSSTSLHRLGDALSDARGEADAMTDDQVSEICKVFSAREETLNQMLHFYHKMYNDLRKEKEDAKLAAPESEERQKLRREFLQFVKETTIAAAAAPTVAGSPALLPDFSEIWNTVFLGK